MLETLGVGYAPRSGPLTARLTFIAEALGENEVIKGEPLVGSAGGVHDRILRRAGVLREATGADNCIRCRPPKNWLVGAPWEHAALNHCRQYLNLTLAAVPDDSVVVPLGATALKSVLNLHGVAGVNLRDFHGTVSRSVDDRYWVVPTFHPSHLQQGAMNLLDVVTEDVKKAARISQVGFTRNQSTLVVDSDYAWFQRWVTQFVESLSNAPDECWLALDTEFPEKAGGADESEVLTWGGITQSPITRVNLARSVVEGLTVPYKEPYITELQRLFDAVNTAQGWVFCWNKYADLDHLRAHHHKLDNECVVDLMWAWHYLQSDLPRGLGFVAPLASDFGAWKHWAHDSSREGEYAAADALQTFRCAVWIVTALQQAHMWDLFFRDWHERDVYCLRPAHEMGVPVDRPELELFHQSLQLKQASILAKIKQTAAAGVLKPKNGYRRKPKSETPPKSIIGKAKGEAKQQYMVEEVRLVERPTECAINACITCGAEGITKKHRCKDGSLTPRVERTTKLVSCWFWQLPFNPDARAQLLSYLDTQGIDAPTDRKTGKATTSAKALKKLIKEHQNDPLFQLQLDWRAVQKVDSTYALRSLELLDSDNRLHPEFLAKPSTLRDSCVNPNLQNVVADRAGADGLATGFRRCIVARDGIPPNSTSAVIMAWEVKWSGPIA